MNLRKLQNEDISQLLVDFINKKVQDEFTRAYIGKVVDNGDPDKVGRCKVRVFGIFNEEISDADLPWAIPEFSFIGSTVGSFIVPPVNTLVNVYFNHGNLYEPVYTTKVLQKSKLPSRKDTDYPKNLIFFETDEGDWFEINTETKMAKFHHNSGTEISIDKNGKLLFSVKDEEEHVVDSNEIHTVKGDETHAIDGKFEVKAKKNLSIECDGPGLGMGAKIEIDSKNGNVSVTQGAVGKILLGGAKAVMYCNDLPSCVITGAPLSIGTKLPGSMVMVP